MMIRNIFGSSAVLAAASVALGQAPQAFTAPIGGVPHASSGGTVSPAAVLWDQSDYDVAAGAFVNQVFDDFPTSSSFQVCDVTTGGASWNVSKVTVYFTRGANSTDLFDPANITTANVQIYSQTSCLPGSNDLPPQLTLPCTLFSPASNVWEISVDTSGTAEFQGINGEYWIGVTPVTTFARDGQEFQFQTVSARQNCESTWRNPGGAFGFGTEWNMISTTIGGGTTYDGAIKLEGTAGGGGYTLSVGGNCPGTVQVVWDGAQPNKQQAIVFAANTGSYVVPSGPCQGTRLGLGTRNLRVVNTVSTGNGSGQVGGNASSGACGGYLQLVTIANPCEASNVDQLP